MNTRIMQIRALDKKTSSLSDAKNIVPSGSGWINTVREAIGMTAVQFAKRLGVTQPRIAKLESNEEILLGVNLNMALENQDIKTQEAVNDMVTDFINGNTKKI